jgi:Luciferase-like monooxygenase
MILGAGIGWMEEEITLLGAPYKKRGALSDEYLRAMRELWNSADPTFHGSYYTPRLAIHLFLRILKLIRRLSCKKDVSHWLNPRRGTGTRTDV